MGERDEDCQLELPLELREPVQAPWWADVLQMETEGDQDTGYWGA
ncbi:MAG: hypothetical protein ACTH6A_06490 [Brachybacterium tyrofermentans]